MKKTLTELKIQNKEGNKKSSTRKKRLPLQAPWNFWHVNSNPSTNTNRPAIIKPSSRNNVQDGLAFMPACLSTTSKPGEDNTDNICMTL